MAGEMETMSVADRLASISAQLEAEKSLAENVTAYRAELQKEALLNQRQQELDIVKAVHDQQLKANKRLLANKAKDEDTITKLSEAAKARALTKQEKKDLAAAQKRLDKIKKYEEKLDKDYINKKIKAEQEARDKAARKQVTKEATDTAKGMFAKGAGMTER